MSSKRPMAVEDRYLTANGRAGATRIRRDIVLAVAGGVMHGACFPGPHAWPFAFVAVAPLLIAVRGRSGIAAAGLGWVSGTVASALAVTPWIAAAALQYFRQEPLGAVLFATGVGQIYHALPCALFAAMAARLSRFRSGAIRVLAVASAWTALELLRSTVLTGAPWDLLAHALYDQPRLIQIAGIGGAYLVSFVLVACSAAAAEIAIGPPDGRRAAAITAIVLLSATVGYGTWGLGTEDVGPHLRVGLVQGNVPNAWRTDLARSNEAFAAFAEATRALPAEHPALIVWPENAVSFLWAPNDRFREAIRTLLGSSDIPLLLGAPRYAQAGDGKVAFFNSAWLLDPAGKPLAIYDKRRLLPFAEYAPFPSLPILGWRFDAPGAYTAGTEPVLFEQPAPFGVLICYEAIYPELARDLVRAGARFLVNISNDAWFGTTAGLEQHFAISVFRAVETHRALARATNTGVTAVVHPVGRITRFPSAVRRGWVVDVPLRDDQTLHTRTGDIFAWLTVAATLLALVAA